MYTYMRRTPAWSGTPIGSTAMSSLIISFNAMPAAMKEYGRAGDQRSSSWHARAEAIRATNAEAGAAAHGGADAHSRLQAEARFKSNLAAMGHAESTERASLEVFARITRSR